MFYSHLQLQILHLIYPRVSFINQDINFNLTLKIVVHGALQSQICVIWKKKGVKRVFDKII